MMLFDIAARADAPQIQAKPYFLLQIIAALVTLGFALLIIAQQPLINVDGTFYMRLADTYLRYGFEKMYALYAWPFYPLMIAKLHQITGLSLFNTALILNIAFQIGITCLFIHLVKLLGGNFKALCFAAIVVLLLPHLNEYRAYFIRDYGYCFFLLFSAYFFIRYCSITSWWRALAFSITAILACSFRFEGFAFLFLIPLLIFSIRNLIFYHKIRAFLKIIACIVALGCLFLGVAFLIYPSLIQKIMSVFAVHEVSAMQLFQLKSQILATVDVLKAKLLTENSPKSLSIFIISGLIGAYLYKLIYVLSPLYTIVAGYSVKKGLMPATPNQKTILLGYILLNLAITVVFFCIYFFVSGRYLLPFVLFAMLWVPFGLAQLYEEWQYMRILRKYKHMWLFALIILALIYMAFSGLVSFGESKAYIKESGLWLKQHTDKNSKIYANEPQILYYAKDSILGWETYTDESLSNLKDNSWRQYHYLAINNDQKHFLKINTQRITLIKTFTNEKGAKVSIYEVPPMMVILPDNALAFDDGAAKATPAKVIAAPQVNLVSLLFCKK